ncbi:Fe-S protein assembly co-chaperone HscB [Candidatus Zinderia endosymbiont of Aphrophora alni]|uniref:Fe-S protein assembly co-chaperone HscB n=1 Tax=Candidatus Zinderia endosymbiont of Aphrophora alni TaxID=3077951 RepID=UPI0030D60C51
MKNYFFLFNLPIIFNINLLILEKKYIQLQNENHPDRFIFLNKKKKKKKIEFSSFINKAYLNLKNPLKRSIYLCKLMNYNLFINKNIFFSKEFLLKQLKLRKYLEYIKYNNKKKKLNKFEINIYKKKKIIINLINIQFIKKNLKNLKELIYNLIFLEKIIKNINNIFFEIK